MKYWDERLLNKPEGKTKQAHHFTFEKEGTEAKLARIVLNAKRICPLFFTIKNILLRCF